MQVFVGLPLAESCYTLFLFSQEVAQTPKQRHLPGKSAVEIHLLGSATVTVRGNSKTLQFCFLSEVSSPL